VVAVAGCSEDIEEEPDTPVATPTEEPDTPVATPTEEPDVSVATPEEQPTEEPEPDEVIYEIGENFVVEEENLEITVTDVRSGETFGPNEADGIFQAVEMDITNIGDESIDIGHSLFEMKDAEGGEARYEPDTEMSVYLEEGISGLYESINPGITTTLQIIFDIPEDVVPELVIATESEYRVELE
jgi:hypothetical protein